MKNKIIIAIAILLSVSTPVLSQTALETSVLKELNHYRDSLGLQPVLYSVEVTKAAKHHTQWMVATNTCDHYETSNAPGIKTLYSPIDRGNFFGFLKNAKCKGEICSFTKAFDGNFFTATKKSDSVLGKDIIIRFSESPEHNKSLLTRVNTGAKVSVGISVITKGEVAYTTIYFIEK